ncbi:MAG: cytochrome c biogenesis protein CcsA [Sphingomonas sp.]
MPVLHALANPTRFLKLARPLTPILFWAGVALAAFGAWAGLALTPPDYLQGETVRILYIHVPSAWLGMGGWSGLAIASLVYLVWRHPLANLAARAIAPGGGAVRGRVPRHRIDLGATDLGDLVGMGTGG